MTGSSSELPTDPDLEHALALLVALARRAGVAARLESGVGDSVLRSVVEAAAALIRAEAASIALHDPSTDRLVFRVAAGEQGAGVVGLAVGTEEGVAGYVFSSGQPLAIGETNADARFQRGAAEQTGYIPRSLLAVPLTDAAGTIGVLEVLDRRDGEPFDLRDMEAASVFAHQATVAIRATRLEHDTGAILRRALASLGASSAAAEPELRGRDMDALVSFVVTSLHERSDDGRELWRLADLVARARRSSPEQTGLVIDILEALIARAERTDHGGGRYRAARR